MNPLKLIAAFFLLIALSHQSMAQLSASLSHQTISLNQSFTLSVEADLARNNLHPEFRSLEKDFIILDRSRSNEVVVVNNQMSQKVTWKIELKAKKAGRLLVPPIKVGKNLTEPLSIDVLDGKTGVDPVFLLEVDVSSSDPYLLEETILKVRFLRARNIAGATIIPPKHTDLIVQPHSNPSVRSEQRRNVTYTIHEQSFSLFPTRAGTIEIDPLTIEIQSRNRIGSSVFTQREKVRLFSDAITLEVQSPPVPINDWFPAHEVTIEEQYNGDLTVLKVAEPITRSVTISVSGQLASQIPSILPERIDGFRVYNNEPKLSQRVSGAAISSTLTQLQVLIPKSQGLLRVPNLSLRWYNTESRRFETTETQESELKINIPADSDAPALLRGNFSAPASSQELAFTTSQIVIIAFLILSGWIASLWIWFNYRNMQLHSFASRVPQDSLNALKSVVFACKQGNPERTYKALLSYKRSLKNTQGEFDNDLKAEFNELQNYLYDPMVQLKRWEHQNLLKLLKDAQRKLEKETSWLKNPTQAQIASSQSIYQRLLNKDIHPT